MVLPQLSVAELPAEVVWLQHFPNADVIRIADAGHFIQEDAHEQVIAELIDFIAATGGNNEDGNQ